VSVVCRGLCDGPLSRPEESYRLWCVIVCDLESSRKRRPWPALGCCARKKKGRFLTYRVAQKSVHTRLTTEKSCQVSSSIQIFFHLVHHCFINLPSPLFRYSSFHLIIKVFPLFDSMHEHRTSGFFRTRKQKDCSL
jgi:hypothetical protein